MRRVDEAESAFRGTRLKHFPYHPIFVSPRRSLGPRATSDCDRWCAFCLLADRVQRGVCGRKRIVARSWRGPLPAAHSKSATLFTGMETRTLVPVDKAGSHQMQRRSG